MGKHELALQHSMKALILIQDELVSKFPMSGEQTHVEESNMGGQSDSAFPQQ